MSKMVPNDRSYTDYRIFAENTALGILISGLVEFSRLECERKCCLISTETLEK